MIVLCSADDKVRSRWSEYIDHFGDVLECTNEQQFIDITKQHKDVIFLLHLNFLQITTIAAITEFIHQHPSIKVIICADVPTDEQGLEFLKAGVYGYCNTWMAEAQIKRVIEQVKAGEVWVGQSLILRLINDLAVASHAKSKKPDTAWMSDLTQRECEVAQLVGMAESNKGIANKLNITERTVKAHLSAVFRKTGCKDRIQLALQVSQS